MAAYVLKVCSSLLFGSRVSWRLSIAFLFSGVVNFFGLSSIEVRGLG